MTEWYQQPLGRTVAAAEAAELRALLASEHGKYLLYLGNNPEISHLKPPLAPCCMSINKEAAVSSTTPILEAEYQALPFANESINIIVMSHILEFEAKMLVCLEESWRILAEEGQLVIFGFNPWSLWGICRLFGTQPQQAPWNGHFHSAEKVRYHLSKLGAEITLCKSIFFGPPAMNGSQNRWLEQIASLSFPSAGGIYILVATKHRTLLTPIRPVWSWQSWLANDKNIAQPTARRVKTCSKR